MVSYPKAFIRTRTRIILRAYGKLRRATISCHMSFRTPTWNNSALTGQISVKIEMSILRKSVDTIQIPSKSDKNIGYLTRIPIYIFLIYVAQFLAWKIFGQKICRENHNTRLRSLSSPSKIGLLEIKQQIQLHMPDGACALNAGYKRLHTTS